MRLQVFHFKRLQAIKLSNFQTFKLLYLRINRLGGQLVQIHLCVRQVDVVLVIPYADVIQLHILDGQQAVEWR